MIFFAHSRIWKPVIIILSVIAAVWVVLAIVLGLFTCDLSEKENESNTKAYEGRAVIIYEAFGTADTECGGKTYGAYEDMQLLADDKFHTYSESYLKLSIDDDKFLLLDAETSAEVQAEGSAEDNKTELILTEGAAVVRIANELKNDACFIVVTPDASIKLRKGIYCIRSGTDENGKIFTVIDACGGSAQATVIRLDGTVVSGEYTVAFGTRTVISGSGAGAAIESENEIPDYENYTFSELAFIEEMLQYGDLISIDNSLLEEYLRILHLPYYTVTFLYNGEVFCIQSVREESTAVVPSLKPAQNGKWDIDFSEPITEDETIEWAEDGADMDG